MCGRGEIKTGSQKLLSFVDFSDFQLEAMYCGDIASANKHWLAEALSILKCNLQFHLFPHIPTNYDSR